MKQFTIEELDAELIFTIRHIILSYFIEHSDGDYIETNLDIDLIKRITQTEDTAFLNRVIRFMTTEDHIRSYAERIYEPVGQMGKAVYFNVNAIGSHPIFALQIKQAA